VCSRAEPPFRRPGILTEDSSLVHAEVKWPRSTHAAPLKKMKMKVDSLLASLATDSWSMGLKDRTIKAYLRLAKQSKEECQSCEFQLLVEMSKKHVAQLEDLHLLGVRHRALESDHTEAKIKQFALVVTQVEEHFKADQITTTPMYCELLVYQVHPKESSSVLLDSVSPQGSNNTNRGKKEGVPFIVLTGGSWRLRPRLPFKILAAFSLF